MSTPQRPALMYHGSKWRIAPWVLSHFPPHRIYTEAYGGGASILLRKARAQSEIYNDVDDEICNLFCVLRDMVKSQELERLIRLTPFARREFDSAYQVADGDVERARRTLVRSLMGHSGAGVSGRKTGFRANSNSAGTNAAQVWMHYPDNIQTFTRRLQGVVVENAPAIDVIKAHDSPQTLHYVDPPYPMATRDDGSDYRYELSDDDHRDLAAVLHSLNGMVILSGYACDLYDLELFPSWRRVEREALAQGGRKRTEVLWLNPAAVRHQANMLEAA